MEINAITPQPRRNETPVVILGCPRSGTLLVSRIIGGHPGNFLITEHSLRYKQSSCPEDRSGIVDHDLWWKHFRFPAYEKDGKRPLVDTPIYDAEAARKLRDEYLAHAASQRLVIKNPTHVLRVDILKEMFPDARFVFCVRHPWHTIQSMVIKANASFLVRPPCFPDLPDDLLLKAAVSWETACEAFFEHHDDNWMTIRYEDLVDQPETTVNALSRFIELKDRAYLAQAASLPHKSNHNYDYIQTKFFRSRYKKEILRRLDRGSRHFGYSTKIMELRSDRLRYIKTLFTRMVGTG